MMAKRWGRGAAQRWAGGFARAALCAALLSGCVGFFGGGVETAVSPITGPEVEVTALPPAAEVTPSASPAVAVPVAASSPAETEVTLPLAPEASPPAAPLVPLSPAQLACAAKKGQWMVVGGSKSACVQRTKDSLKACRRAQDCTSHCLARSNTCAPFQPMFGCHEILDDMGRRMTQCLD